MKLTTFKYFIHIYKQIWWKIPEWLKYFYIGNFLFYTLLPFDYTDQIHGQGSKVEWGRLYDG